MSKIGIFNENAEFFEEFCNSQEDTALDRFGRERKTIEGIDNGVTDLINNKIIAQGGLDVLQERGNRTDATMSQNSISSNLDGIDSDISRIDSEVSQKWDTQTTVGTGNIVRESAVPVVVSETGDSSADAISQKAFTDLSFGIGQKWVDLTAQRSLNIDYVNATENPLMVSVSTRTASDVSALLFYVDDLIVADSISRYSSTATSVNITMIVPAKSKYRVEPGISSAGNKITWCELMRDAE